MLKNINTIYSRNHKYYDFKESENEIGLYYRINNAKPFKVHHADGTCSLAYEYGEHQYSFDYNDVLEQREKDNIQKAYNKERKALMEKINSMTNEELKALLEK